MKKRMIVKRSLILVLVFALISGGMSLAQETGQSTLRMSFPDVPSGNWAEKHVSKLALLGITEGDDRGRFNPTQPVIQQDVIKMAMSMLGYTESDGHIESSSLEVIQFLNEYVSDYARPYVNIAFREGMLDFDVEYDNAKATGQWGRTMATREWVAHVIIHAIGKAHLANELTLETPPFKDHAAISAWAVGYVNAAVQLNIVTGFDDGEFKPKESVTRAQMATLLSKAEHYLPNRSDRVLIGTLIELSDDRVTVSDASGAVKQLNLHKDLKYYSIKVPNDPVPKSEFKALYKIYVIHHGGTAYYLEILEDELQLSAVDGVLLAKDLSNIDEQTITLLTTEGNEMTFILDPNVIVLNPDGTGASLGSLIEHSHITVKRNLLQNHPKVIQIVIQSLPVNKTAKGVIMALDASTLQVTLSDENDGTSEAFTISSDVRVTYGDKVLSGIHELNVGDKVEYEIRNSVVTSIQLIEPIVPYMETIQGTVLSFDLDANIINIENEDGLLVRRFADHVIVHLKGSNMATLKDLQIGDRVNLKVNHLDRVTEVTILNREISKLIQVEIDKYFPDSMSLIVLIDKKPEIKQLNEDTIIEFGGKTWNIQEFDFATYFTAGKRVDMTFSNDRLMEIKLSQYYDGILRQIDPLKRKITIETETGQLQLDLATYTAVDIAGKTTASLSDLNVGDPVRLVLNTNQNAVGQIQLRQTMLYQTVNMNVAAQEVTATDPTGKQVKFKLNNDTVIRHHTKLAPTILDIKAGEPLVVSYYGKSIVSVDIPRTLGVGRVSNVSDTKLTLYHYHDEIQDIYWTKDSKVYVNGVANSDGFKALQIGDRISVLKDAQDNVYISKLEQKKRTFKEYKATTNTIYFSPSGGWDDIEFTVHPDLVITENGKPLQLRDLKFLDSLIIYLLDGELVEIERIPKS